MTAQQSSWPSQQGEVQSSSEIVGWRRRRKTKTRKGWKVFAMQYRRYEKYCLGIACVVIITSKIFLFFLLNT